MEKKIAIAPMHTALYFRLKDKTLSTIVNEEYVTT